VTSGLRVRQSRSTEASAATDELSAHRRPSQKRFELRTDQMDILIQLLTLLRV